MHISPANYHLGTAPRYYWEVKMSDEKVSAIHLFVSGWLSDTGCISVHNTQSMCGVYLNISTVLLIKTDQNLDYTWGPFLRCHSGDQKKIYQLGKVHIQYCFSQVIFKNIFFLKLFECTKCMTKWQYTARKLSSIYQKPFTTRGSKNIINA